MILTFCLVSIKFSKLFYLIMSPRHFNKPTDFKKWDKDVFNFSSIITLIWNFFSLIFADFSSLSGFETSFDDKLPANLLNFH